MSENRVYGIDLGTTYTCIAHVDDTSGRPMVTPNIEGELTTPSVVLFEDDETRVVGREAKNTALLEADRVIEMIKREIGKPNWRREFFGREVSPEEISSYILRKAVDDAERHDRVRPQKVVITCPAYFDVPQREATATAGRIAGLDVLEIINEPTAAAITYGMQDKGDQTLLVYDLGGGTFDITVIEIKDGAIRVVATGGNDQLGGRDWDEEIVKYCAAQWEAEYPGADGGVLSSPDTVQALWLRAESSKRTLTAMPQARIPVVHDGKQVAVSLTREKFEELTAPLLENTVTYTKAVIETARELGSPSIDRLLLVGGSTKMPQVAARLQKEFGIEIESFEPDFAVAKGAAIYGQKLAINERIRHEIGRRTDTRPEDVDVETTPDVVREEAEEVVADTMGLRLGTVKKIGGMAVTNVSSHSFGVLAFLPDDTQVIANLVLAQQALPAESTMTFGTKDGGAPLIELKIFENTSGEKIVRDLDTGEEVTSAVLEMQAGLPPNSPIDVTFRLDGQGRLHITGQDKAEGGNIVRASVETDRVLSAEEVEQAIEYGRGIRVIG
ncbi:Hsp70 family protein [Actinomadura graeca]|uniref:Hsp70 family protein n=1 Tax=Actinomadura graeca TaxID=2750812 RepID=A0ABX8QRQ2_9ACTN|nr:Hsp70 family protein [Actinomadura graeca]QXJ21490.1 Hsp70 family protein [Actinomadura graeca]